MRIEKMPKTAVTFGDIVVDYVCDIPLLDLGEVGTSGNINTTIDMVVGGAGVQFALAAKRIGFENSIILGKIGGLRRGEEVVADRMGEWVLDYLHQEGLTPYLGLDTKTATGKVMVSYFPDGKRFMVSDPQANKLFSENDITPEMLDSVANSDLFYISGYVLLDECRRKALSHLLEAAQTGRTKTILDLVPHNIYKFFTFEEISDLANLIDWIIVELPTAYQIAGLGKLPEYTENNLEEILGIFEKRFSAGAVFYKPNAASLFTKDGHREKFVSKESQPIGKASRGFSSNVQASLLLSIMYT